MQKSECRISYWPHHWMDQGTGNQDSGRAVGWVWSPNRSEVTRKGEGREREVDKRSPMRLLKHYFPERISRVLADCRNQLQLWLIASDRQYEVAYETIV